MLISLSNLEGQNAKKKRFSFLRFGRKHQQNKETIFFRTITILPNSGNKESVDYSEFQI